MTNSVVLRSYLPDTGVFNSTVVFRTPLKLPESGLVKVQCSSVHISDRIPNVFNAYPFGRSFNNTVLRVGTDTQPYQTITLDTGLYLTGPILMAAINAAINNSLHWWTDPNKPGLQLVLNNVIDKFVILIDSIQLNPLYGTQFKLDLREATTGSQLYQTLGYTSTTELTADGAYTSPNVPRMDTQGTTAIVTSSLVPVRIVNEGYQSLVASISFSGHLDASDIVWPPGGVISTVMIYSGPRTITQATFSVLTSDGDLMIFMNGQLMVELGFYW